ncbi:NUDIX domain-containing protein [Naumannella sp. ID2617S]|nr:NUDIX domain-containing protein [Naumannella sp. ID2617S]
MLRLREKIGTDLLWLPGVTVVVIDRRTPQPRVLCVRRADNGQWTPVTGIVDPGEEPAAAGEREVLEEAGVEARWFGADELPPMNDRFQRAVRQALGPVAPALFNC